MGARIGATQHIRLNDSENRVCVFWWVDDVGDVHAELQQLRGDFENLRRSHEKRLDSLTTELDEEKKIRLNLQVEVERLKKRLAD